MASRKKKKKPAPISMALHKTPEPVEAPAAFNDVSPITQQQMDRAEQAIDTLRQEVNTLRKAKPVVKVDSTPANVTVEIPPRPRIAKVSIKYDQLGFPSELIPQYSKAEV